VVRSKARISEPSGLSVPNVSCSTVPNSESLNRNKTFTRSSSKTSFDNFSWLTACERQEFAADGAALQEFLALPLAERLAVTFPQEDVLGHFLGLGIPFLGNWIGGAAGR
jgi:hypothetical protein